MNSKKTLALALLLGLAVLYLTKVFVPGRAREEGERKAFSGMQPEQMTRIDVSRRSFEGQVEQFTISRKVAEQRDIGNQGNGTTSPDTKQASSAQWSLPAVRGAVLDTNAVGEFLNTLKDLPVEDALSDRERQPDLSVYGLDKPVVTIVVHKGENESIEVAFGKKNEYLSRRYAKVSGRSGVFLVPDALFSTLNKGSTDIRSKNPVQFNVVDVRKATITHAEGQIVVAQPAVGEWKIMEPKELSASKDAVDALLNSLRNVTVTEFIDSRERDQSAPGFENPKVAVHLQMRDGSEPAELVIKVAAGTGEVGAGTTYMRVRGVDSLYKLSADPSSSLVKRVNDLRERSIVGVGRSEIETVVSGGSGITPTTIASSGLLWTVNGKDGDPVFIEQYLQDLSDVKADEFPEEAPADAFEPPFLTLSITTKDPEKQTVVLTVGKELTGEGADSLRYVKTSRSGDVYAIRDVEAKRLVPHEEALAAQPTPTPEPTKNLG